jgi:hypothetical protein
MTTAVPTGAETCFFEQGPDMPLVRRAMVEGIGGKVILWLLSL